MTTKDETKRRMVEPRTERNTVGYRLLQVSSVYFCRLSLLADVPLGLLQKTGLLFGAVSIFGHPSRVCGRAVAISTAYLSAAVGDSPLNQLATHLHFTDAENNMVAANEEPVILIAEDQDYVREALAMLLRGHGYSVTLCASPKRSANRRAAAHARRRLAGHELSA